MEAPPSTGPVVTPLPQGHFLCSICDSDFDLEAEGGIVGEFGICPVAFCCWCLTSIHDMVGQTCFRCIEAEEEE